MSTDNNKNRHVLDSHLVGRFDASSGNSRVCAIDDLTVEGLDFVVCSRHLIHENILHSGAIGNWIAIEENCGWGGSVEGADGVAVFSKGGIE